jgi:ABC-type nitrate/sulfonate/bicarbonate transport system permease component
MVAAELFLSASGMGALIMRSSQDFDTPGLYAAILVVTILLLLSPLLPLDKEN